MATSENGRGAWDAAREALAGGRLSVIMPAYNLGTTVAANVAAVAAVLEGNVDYEIVPVDDGSADGTAGALRAAAAANPARVRPVFVAVNAGKGNALREGFRASTGAFVLLLDGDLDLRPERIPGFFDVLRDKGADIVIGSKRHPDSDVRYPWHRRLASAVYYGIVRLLVGLPVTDTQVGMKLFRRQVLGDALDRMLVKTFAFDLELLSIAFGRGAKVAEAPVTLAFGAVFGGLTPRAVKSVMNDTLAVFYRLRVLKYYASVEVPPPCPRPPRVSVVIACPNDSPLLRQCLAGVARQTHPRVEAIVLPDAPFDAAGLPAPPDGLRVLPTGKVRPAEKRNAGIAAARGEVVAFIDDDAYPDAHWIESAVKYFAFGDVGGVGGPGVTPPDDGFLARMGGRVYANRLVSGGYRYRYVGGRTLRRVDDYPSCNLLVRTDLLRAFGGYRTDFWPGEDTLLCRDILAAGKRIVYDPWATVFHHRRPLFGAHLRQLGRYAFHRGYFCKRFPENSRHLAYFVPSAFVAYLLTWLPVSAISVAPGSAAAIAVMAYQSLLGVYLVLVLLTTFALNPAVWAATAAGVIATHVTYGIRFLHGLCARRAPCEFIGGDHP